MAARVVGIRQEGVKPCRMVSSMKGQGTWQLHDVTGKVQRARLRIVVQMHDVRVAALELREITKKMNEFENKSKPRFRVNRIPRSGVKDPLSYLGHRTPLLRGMG